MSENFFHVKRLDETVSTNEDAKHAAEAGEAEGLVFHALSQTGGKGRQGRNWVSPTGNLYASLLLRPYCDAQTAGLYSFVTALAVADTVRSFLPRARVELKWPNDVLVGGKKISGILLECGPMQEGQIGWLVIGTGINVAHKPENPMYPATCLSDEGVKQCSVEVVLDAYLKHLAHWREIFLTRGFGPVREAWLERAKTGEMVARLPREEVRGVFDDLDPQGRLVLRFVDGSTRAITAADVFFDVKE